VGLLVGFKGGCLMGRSVGNELGGNEKALVGFNVTKVGI
jgi:hypothetical protein